MLAEASGEKGEQRRQLVLLKVAEAQAVALEIRDAGREIGPVAPQRTVDRQYELGGLSLRQCRAQRDGGVIGRRSARRNVKTRESRERHDGGFGHATIGLGRPAGSGSQAGGGEGYA